MKIDRSVLLFALVVIVSTVAAVAHLMDETLETVTQRVRP